MTTHNPDEKIEIPRIGVLTIGVSKVPFINVFGNTDRAYDVVDTDEPYLLWEDGSPMLWENGDKFLLEQQKKKVWQQRARR